MSVRLSTQQIYHNGLNGMLDIQRAANETQLKISTGRKVLTPGDDPVAATRILQLTQDLRFNELYENNMKSLQSSLEREEVALASISDMIQRSQELVIQSGDGVLNPEQLQSIGVELQSIVDAMALTMNSRDAAGDFIFAGLNARSEPFVKGLDGRYNYVGDEGQRAVQVGPGSFVAATDSGHKIFMDVESTANTISASANPHNRAVPPAVISSERIVNQEAFDEFYPNNAVIEFRPIDEVEPAVLTYDVKQVSDGRILLKNVPYVPGADIEFAGTSVKVTGDPAVGDTFLVSSTDKKGLLTTIEDMARTLAAAGTSAQEREKISAEISVSLGNLQNAQSSLLEVRSSVGARLNLVETNRGNGEDIKLATQKSLSELQDLDYAEAVSKLSQETFMLEAAQASFARISGLTLFNYL